MSYTPHKTPYNILMYDLSRNSYRMSKLIDIFEFKSKNEIVNSQSQGIIEWYNYFKKRS